MLFNITLIKQKLTPTFLRFSHLSDLVKQLMFSWADHQMTNIENGMIQESLSQGCLEETSREGNVKEKNFYYS